MRVPERHGLTGALIVIAAALLGDMILLVTPDLAHRLALGDLPRR
jgi:hypothetical protein